ncbi:MAG: hypothetical protein WCR42_06870 [bacterium]
MKNNDTINKKNAEVIIKFYHPSVSSLSDRTLKSLIRGISKTCRDIQMIEIEHLIKDFDIDYKLRQSLKDKALHQLPNEPSFYTKKISKGSFELTVLLSLAGFWVLNNLILESVKKAFQDSKLGSLTYKKFLSMFNSIHKHVIDRPNYFTSDILPSLKNRKITDRFFVDEIEVVKTDENLLININLETISNLDIEELSKELDYNTLMKKITVNKKITKELNKEYNSTD